MGQNDTPQPHPANWLQPTSVGLSTVSSTYHNILLTMVSTGQKKSSTRKTEVAKGSLEVHCFHAPIGLILYLLVLDPASELEPGLQFWPVTGSLRPGVPRLLTSLEQISRRL